MSSTNYTPTESRWTASVCNELELAGAVVVPHVAGQHASGWPDRIIWHPLWRGWVEFKGEKTPLAKRQARNLFMLDRRRAGTAVVVRYPGQCEDSAGNVVFTFATAKELLEKLAERERQLNVSPGEVALQES